MQEKPIWFDRNMPDRQYTRLHQALTETWWAIREWLAVAMVLGAMLSLIVPYFVGLAFILGWVGGWFVP